MYKTCNRILGGYITGMYCSTLYCQHLAIGCLAYFVAKLYKITELLRYLFATDGYKVMNSKTYNYGGENVRRKKRRGHAVLARCVLFQF